MNVTTDQRYRASGVVAEVPAVTSPASNPFLPS